jgi:hypothetical protein
MSATRPTSGPSATETLAPPVSRTPAPRRVRRFCAPGLGRLVLGVAATIPILVYLWVAFHRLGYPFELDWMEGGSVELAARAAAGHSLYVAPSLSYVGWTYTPLYYWVAAAMSHVIGIGFLPLRLVSFLASGVSMAVLATVVIRETGQRAAGLVAAGLFAATFVIAGAWFDTGRVDSLFVALTLLAVAWGARARGISGGVVLGVLSFLAVFTKQTAVVALVPVLGYLALTRWRVGVPALIVLAVLGLGSTLALDATTGGWYRYYVVSELSHQPWAEGEWVQFWTRDLVGHLWPALALMLPAVLLARSRGALCSLRSPAVYYGLAGAGLVGAAWVSRLHTGGYANVLIPAYAALALGAGLACGECLRAGRERVGIPVAVAAVVTQVGLLAYSPASQIPTRTDRTAGVELIARLRALRGPVVVLRHPWYATLAGKGSFAQEEAINDVLRSDDPRGARGLGASLRRALDADNVQAVVLDGTYDAHLLEPELSREFRLSSEPVTPSRLYPLTDARTAPTLLYVRRLATRTKS